MSRQLRTTPRPMGTLCLWLCCALLGVSCDDGSPAPGATVGLARAIRGGMFVGAESDGQPVVDPRRVPAGARVTTDGAGPGVLQLDNGAFLLVGLVLLTFVDEKKAREMARSHSQ